MGGEAKLPNHKLHYSHMIDIKPNYTPFIIDTKPNYTPLYIKIV